MFTDIEASTQLALRLGPDFASTLAEHFDLIRRCVSGEGGNQVKTTGDGVFAVFASAPSALAAARATQRAFASHGWPIGGDVRIRMGIHTGEATLSDGDYAGVEVHRAARLMTAGHGGQILVSETTRSLAGAELEFRDLGRHLLRGLEADEHIYQLVVDGLPADFPPLRTASAAPNNLPARVSSIVGRESEVSALSGLLEDNRLVTVLGPGGVGKTSLAVTVGGRVLERFPGGVTFVDLSSVGEPEFVVTSVAAALGVEPPTVVGVAAHLGGSKGLLILDNFEQVVAASGEVAGLLERAPETRVIVTSQIPLRIAGEHRYLLAPFETDDPESSPGVELFMERAHAVNPGFAADTGSVAELVGHLDGLPLAIELAAARANVLDPVQMLARLREGRWSHSPLSDAPVRHRSLYDAMAWSHDLLSEPTRIVFRRLGVFAGPMSLEAAETVAGGAGVVDPLSEIGELVDRSLLVSSIGTVGWFNMLEGIRRFARNRLEESEEAGVVVSAFVDYFLAHSRAAHSGLEGERGEWWRAQLQYDLENLREVLSNLQARGRVADGLELLGNLWRFYQSRGHMSELEVWLERFFSLAGSEADSVGVVKGLMARGALHYWQKRPDAAVADYRDAVGMARRLDRPSVLAEALLGLATSYTVSRRPEKALPLLEECQEIYGGLDDRSRRADVIAAEAFAEFYLGHLTDLGAKFGAAAEIYEETGRTTEAVQAIYGQAGVALAEGRLDDSHELTLAGITMATEVRDVFLQVWGLEYLARINQETGDLEMAGYFAGVAEMARGRIGGGWSPETIGMVDNVESLANLVGEKRSVDLLAPGREASLEEAIERAIG